MAQASQISEMQLQVLGTQAETWGARGPSPWLPIAHPAPSTHPTGFPSSCLFFPTPIPGYLFHFAASGSVAMGTRQQPRLDALV